MRTTRSNEEVTVLELRVDASAIEAAMAALVAAGARELELFDEEAPPLLAALFDAFEPKEALNRVDAALIAAKITAHDLTARASSQVESTDHWCPRPLRFGPLWILPPGRSIPKNERGAAHALIIESAGANVFGSGAHASTALCLERIVELEPSGTVLDVGTGSGVLALAALALGAEHAVATERDPASRKAAQRNAEANALDDRFELRAELPAAADAKFDLVVANIIAHTLLDLAPEVVRRLDSGGTVLLSGIRTGEAEEIARAYKNFGLHRGADDERDGWVRLELSAAW